LIKEPIQPIQIPIMSLQIQNDKENIEIGNQNKNECKKNSTNENPND